MNLQFLGHAAFALELAGVRVCLDPHKPGAVGGRFQLPEIVGDFDLIAATHAHEDHNAWTPRLRAPQRIDGDADLGALRVRGRAVFHDAVGGRRMGLSTMLALEGEGVRVVHCGDIGHWDAADVAWLQGTDVLLVPVGGTYTLDGPAAAALTRLVAPRMVVPMHAADPRVDLQLAHIDDFLACFSDPPLRSRALSWRAGAPTPAAVVVLEAPQAPQPR